jgi:hypothetical protein
MERRNRGAMAVPFTTAVFLTAAVLHAQQFGPWQAAISVDPGRTGVNRSANDGCPIEAPDGQRLVIASNRPGTIGMNDLWASFRASESDPWGAPVNLDRPVNTKRWSPPVNLGRAVNSPGSEKRATLSWEGRRLYFGRDGDIYSSTRFVPFRQ